MTGRRVAERERAVQRRVFVTRRRLDRRDDLARDAELGERAERRLLLDPVVAHGLVEADEALLDQVIGISACDEVARRLEADEAVVAPDHLRLGCPIAVARLQDEVQILDLTLNPSGVRSRNCGCHALVPAPTVF